MSRLRPSMVLTLAWLKSCITERKKETLVDGELADFYKLTSEIPQGSILVHCCLFYT